MVIELSSISMSHQNCEDYLICKQSINASKSHMHMKVIGLLHVAYSYVCGPFEVSLLWPNNYFISFVDEYSCMTWLYLIKLR